MINEGCVEGSMTRRVTDRIGERVLGFYERHVDEPGSLGIVYLGFLAFFGGIALGVVGIGVFLWSGTYPESTAAYWGLRETAIVLAATGLPVLLASFVVLLPIDRRALYVAGLGLAVTVVAIAVFVDAYPYDWNVEGQDYSSTGVLIYAAGLVLLTGASGAALVTNYIRHTRPADVQEVADDGNGESVSDEEVAEDIAAAVSETELSWGGVDRRESRRLELQSDDVELDPSGFDGVDAVETRGSGVDEAVQGLQGLRGNTQQAASGAGADEQVAALQEMRAQQLAEDDEASGVVGRVKGWLGL